MNKLFVAFLLLIITNVFSQNIPPQLPNKTINGMKEGEWVLWKDANNQFTNEIDSVNLYEIIHFVNDKPEGKVKQYYTNGQLQWEGYLSSFQPHTMEKEAKWYYKDGTLRMTGNYVDNQEEGEARFYYKNGNLQYIANFSDGKLNGKAEIFFDNGKLNYSGEYENGAEIGNWIWYKKNGKIDSTVNYSSWDKLNENMWHYAGEKNYIKRLEYAQKALKAAEVEFGVNHGNYYIISMANLGYAYADNNDFNNAVQTFLKSVELIELHKKTSNYHYVEFLAQIINNYVSLGLLEKANSYYEKAVANLFVPTTREELLGYTTILNNFAQLNVLTGQYDKAESDYKKVIKIYEDLGEDDTNGYFVTCQNLAYLYGEKEQYKESIDLYVEILNKVAEKYGKQHRLFGLILSNLGSYFVRANEFETALSIFQAAKENIELNEGTQSATYNACINNFGILYKRMGDVEQALKYYHEALQLSQFLVGKEHEYYIKTLNNIIDLDKNFGNIQEALALQDSSIFYNKKRINNTFRFLSESEKETFIKMISIQFDKYQSLCLEAYNNYPIAANQIYDIGLVSKNLILSSTLDMRKSIESSHDSNIIETYNKWINNKEKLAKEYTLPIAERTSNIADLEEKTEVYEKQLIKYSKEFGGATQIGKTSWKDVQNALKPNEVAIEFSTFEDQTKIDTNSTSEDLPERITYVASLLQKDKAPQLVKLFTQNELNNLLTSSGSGKNQVDNLYRGAKATTTNKLDLTKIYDLVWKPLTVYLKDGETIYFAPSGTLNQIAFSAITTPDDKYLSDKYDLRQVSTTAKLLEETSTEKFTDITLFGGINYDEDSKTIAQSVQNIQGKDAFISRSLTEDLNRGGETWSYLQGTLTEVERIQTVAQKGKTKVNYYTGNRATEEQFKALNGKNSPQILHIATHGFFFPDPEIKKEDLEKMQLMGEQQNMFKLSDNPLNRSGLLFAGANHTWQGDKPTANIEDGILTAYEASNVALPNTKLVVLSACETGLGDIQGSEGVYGLQRSFKMAGAKYLLMSLWQVPDKETAEFMEYFYIKLFASNDIEASYKATQEYMKGKYANEPYKWAAFVLVR